MPPSEPPASPAIKTVHRRKLTKDFTVLPNQLLRDAGLSFCARGMLAMMLSHSEEWDASARWLEGQTPTEGRERIRAALAELEAQGYAVKAVERDGAGLIVRHVWTWYDAMIPAKERSNALGWRRDSEPAPLAGSPLVGKPQVDESPKVCGLSTCSSSTCGKPVHTEELALQKNSQTENLCRNVGGEDLFLEGLSPPPNLPKAPKGKAYPPDDVLEADAVIAMLYKAYPRKEAPKPARKAIWDALKEATAEELLAGVERYTLACKGKETRHIAHPASWFNAGRWKDEHTTHDQNGKAKSKKFW